MKSSLDLLNSHLQCLLPIASEIFSKAANMLEKYPSSLELLYNVLLDSLAGAMLLKVLNSLLLLPGICMKNMLLHFLTVLTPLDRLNRMMPSEIQTDNDYHLSGNIFYLILNDSITKITLNCRY